MLRCRFLEDQLDEIFTSAVAALVSGLAVTILFTVPGFLMHSAFLRGMRRPESHDRVFLARAVAGSLLVQAAGLPWTLPLIGRLDGGVASSWEIAAWVLIVIIIGPVLAGSVLAAAIRLRRPRWLAVFLDFVGLAHHVSTPDAWQWHFSRRRPHYVRVHLKDQRVVIGYLGSQSFASSDSSNRDLYLERQYAYRDGKAYGPAVPASDGVWISGDEIAFVEFHRSGADPLGPKEADHE